MPKDKSTLVLPGGETKCLFSDSGPYSFQVIPGDIDKVLVYFQGGGACWDEKSTSTTSYSNPMCLTRAKPDGAIEQLLTLGTKTWLNKYTILSVLYCSGDLHLGNAQREYVDRFGQPVEQRGLVNTQAALNWLFEQQTAGMLAPIVSELLIAGSSAGSIGAQIWARQILAGLQWDRAAVIADSYVGVFPDHSFSSMMTDVGFCSATFLSNSEQEDCTQRTADMSDIFITSASANSDVPYAFIQSKVDDVQIKYYEAVAQSGSYADARTSPGEFYAKTNDILAKYAVQLNNMVVYLVNGPNHVFFKNILLTADAMGPTDAGRNYEGLMLAAWLARLPLRDGQTIASVCAGPRRDPSPPISYIRHRENYEDRRKLRGSAIGNATYADTVNDSSLLLLHRSHVPVGTTSNTSISPASRARRLRTHRSSSSPQGSGHGAFSSRTSSTEEPQGGGGRHIGDGGGSSDGASGYGGGDGGSGGVDGNSLEHDDSTYCLSLLVDQVFKEQYRTGT